MASLLAIEIAATLHVLGAAAWVGGQLALAPMTRALRGDRERLRALARAAQPVLWGGFLVAVASGAYLVAARGLAWSGGLVAWKVGIAIVAALGALAHVLAPRRGWPRWVTGAGATLALAGGLALVVLGVLLRWS